MSDSIYFLVRNQYGYFFVLSFTEADWCTLASGSYDACRSAQRLMEMSDV